MTRPFRQQIDDGILERAAALFAQRGFAKTSVQDVADSVGLSKAGLLHHFPSKHALHEAVLAHAATMSQVVADSTGGLPAGADRDRRVIELVVDVAVAHPGMVALMLSPVTQARATLDDPDPDPDFGPAGDTVLAALGVADPRTADPDRLVRVLGALSALAVLSISAAHRGCATSWRPHIVATCLDALGHRRPTPTPSPLSTEA